MITAGGQIPPLDPFFNIFIPKCHPSKANFIQTHHLMNRSVRRHLDPYKKTFFENFRTFSLSPRGSWNSEKTWLFGFLVKFWMFFYILTNLMMKNQLKWRLFLKYVLHHLQKVQKTQDITLSLNTTGGLTPKFCRKKTRKNSFSQFSSLEICRIPIKHHLK